MKRIIHLIAISLFITACGSKVAESASDEAIADAVDSKVQAQLVQTPAVDVYSDGKTKLIKTVNYRFQVSSVKECSESIEALIIKYPAYISSTNLHLENPILENKMTIRVKSEFFYDLLKEIDRQAVFVNYRNVETEDVSKQFVDLESRLKTKREVEARYAEILRSKTGTIEEVLSVEQQIGSLHEEIEATVSRINFLKDQVSYSVINLEFYQTVTEQITSAEEPGVLDEFKNALSAGWSGVLAFLIALVYIWPIIILAISAMIIARVIRNKRKVEQTV